MREREFASFPVEIAQVGTKGRTLTGYASAFDYPIDSGTHSHPQTTFVRPGAFTKTLKENRGEFQVLVNHGMDPRWGMSPVAVIDDIHQDKVGLKLAASIIDDPFFDPLVASFKAGAYRALSIQFEDMTAPDERFNEDRTERNIREVRLYEAGPVTFPANEGAVATLHSLIDLATLLGKESVTVEAESTEDQAETLAEGGRATEEAGTPPADDRLTRWLHERRQKLEHNLKEVAKQPR